MTQSRPALIISALISSAQQFCPAVPPVSAAYQCPSVPPIINHHCCISEQHNQCLLINAHQCSFISATSSVLPIHANSSVPIS
ncbi:unnamed protein product, partial [Staurois parvus]